jgi:transcriptional regulator with XRE-family HTH domain
MGGKAILSTTEERGAFAKLFRDERARAGVTQIEFANKLKVPPGSLGVWERSIGDVPAFVVKRLLKLREEAR